MLKDTLNRSFLPTFIGIATLVMVLVMFFFLGTINNCDLGVQKQTLGIVSCKDKACLKLADKSKKEFIKKSTDYLIIYSDVWVNAKLIYLSRLVIIEDDRLIFPLTYYLTNVSFLNTRRSFISAYKGSVNHKEKYK